jgi:hypothetical protein
LAGIVISAVLGKIVESLLFGIHSNDPSTFVLGSGVLTLIALAACGIPAIGPGGSTRPVTLRSE